MRWNALFHDQDETAWLQEHLRLARWVAVFSAGLFVAYALVDDHIRAGSLASTWTWRLLGGLLCLSTLVSFVPTRSTRWGVLHAGVASMGIISIVNLIFFGILNQPLLGLASQMQCFMMLAMLGPLRSMAWTGSIVALLSFNMGLVATSANADLFITGNVFTVFGIVVLLGISHAAHRNYRDQRRLQSQAQIQSHIVESSSDAILGCNSQGRITSWNRGAQNLFAWSSEQAKGQPIGVLFSAQTASNDTHQLHMALRGHWQDHFHTTWVGRDGTAHEVSVTLSPIAGSDGLLNGVSIIAHDISAEKQAERLLHEKDAQFRTAIETSQEGFWAADGGGRILDVNNAYCRMSGYSRNELLTMCIADLEAHESPEGAAAHIANVHRNGSDTFETLHRRNDGTVWPVEVSTTYSALDGGRFFIFIKDLTERRRVEAMAWHQANYDPLTQLPNRALLFDRLEKACAQSLRSGSPLALLFADLDGFKQVNDVYGHAAGDVVLKEVARRWMASVRSADTVARLGGDEFAVILGGATDPQAASTIAQKLIDALGAPFALTGEGQASIGVSIGIALFPQDAQAVDALISQADTAMYESKRRGKNRYSFAAGSTPPQS